MPKIRESVITAIIAPTILFGLQVWREKSSEDYKYLQMHLLRVELMINMVHNTCDAQTIRGQFDEYTGRGGNSYMVDYFGRWEELYDKECVYEKVSVVH